MCIKKVKKLEEVKEGTGYKVFCIYKGNLIGDWTGNKTRPIGKWIKAKDYVPKIAESGRVDCVPVDRRKICPCPTPRVWPPGWSVFISKQAAQYWLNWRSYGTKTTYFENTIEATIRKIAFRNSSYKGKIEQYTCYIADEIKILP